MQNALRAAALHFLQTHHTGVLSTISPDNTPHGAVVFYYCSDAFELYFVTKQDSAKAKNIAGGAPVAFTVFTDTDKAVTVQITGNAELVSDHATERTVVEKISRKIEELPYTAPLINLPQQGIKAYKITTTAMNSYGLEPERQAIVEL